MSRNFRSAATKVLSRTGKPMHYNSITHLAIQLGVLESKSPAPERIMSRTLSGLVADQSQSVIKRVRPGVYELLPTPLVIPEEGKSHDIGARVQGLVQRLGCADDVAALRKAFRILRECLRITTSTGTIRIGDGVDEVPLHLLDLQSVKAARDELLGVQNWPPHEFRLTPPLIQVGEELRVRLGLPDLVSVIDVAVSLVEISSRLHSDGYIIASGPVQDAMIWVGRSG